MKISLNKTIAAIFTLLGGIPYICHGQPLKEETTFGLGTVFLIAVGVAAIVAIVAIGIVTARTRKNICPGCGKHQMRKSGFETTQISRSVMLHTTIYTCPGCATVRTRTHKAINPAINGNNAADHKNSDTPKDDKQLKRQ